MTQPTNAAEGTPTKRVRPRVPLTRELVLQSALRIADLGGLESLSMRKLGQELGVEAMAIYYHFANKDQLLDGMVDVIIGEIDPPVQEAEWKTAVRHRILSARRALLAIPGPRR